MRASFRLVEFYIILVDFCQDSRALTFIRAADLALPSRSHLSSFKKRRRIAASDRGDPKPDFSLAPNFYGRKYDVLLLKRRERKKSVKEPIMKLVTTLHSNFHVIFVTIVLLHYAQSQLESNVNTLRYDGEVNIGKVSF